MGAMPDYTTVNPAGVELAQLAEVVSCHTTVNQNAAVQMQIPSMHEQIMLKNIPITTDNDFIITLLKTYQLGFHQNSLHTRSIPHREKRHNSACLMFGVLHRRVSHSWV